MQSPTASDPSFKAFLDKLQEQNNRSFVTQLVQLKAEREIAGEDNDKREEQLDEVIFSLKEVRSAVTGIKIDLDITPLVNIGENQIKLLDEIFKESSLTRKLTEGSVEYSKEMAGYRNTSGRDVTNEVSGKVSRTGQVIDFETARDALSAQGKRAKEANAFDLKPINYTPGKATGAAVRGREKPAAEEEEDKVDRSLFERIKDSVKFKLTDGLSEKPGTGLFQTPSKDVEKKEREAKVSSPRQENPEADNIASTGEIEADAAKSDLEISKQMLDTTKAQLIELKEIRKALAPDKPKDLPEKKNTPIAATEESDRAGGGGGGIGLGGALSSMGGLGKGLMTAGKGALSYALPAAAMVGTGAAVDYGLGKLGVGKDKEGNDLKIDTAQDDANFARMSLGQKVQSGLGRGIEKVGSALFLDNISREARADRIKNETEYFKDKDFVDSSGVQDEANYNKMSFGKKIRSSINRAGEKLSLFDSTKTTAARIRKETEYLNKNEPGAATKEALAAPLPTVKGQDPAEGKTTTSIQFSEMEFAKKDPDNYKKFVQFKEKRTEEIARDNAKKFGKKEPRSIDYEIAETKAKVEAIEKFKKEIEASGAGKSEAKVEKSSDAERGAYAVQVSKSDFNNKEQQTKTGSEPGVVKATAVDPKETIDGKKVKPVKDVDKAQQAAKEKYQASTSGEKAASEKLKAFEKENPFDYREKPTAIQNSLDMPGTGKFKDPKKQKEYDDILKAKEQASDSKRSAGAEYTAAEGVTKTQTFTGGEQPLKPGDQGGMRAEMDRKIGGMQSDAAKIKALKKRGYTDKDLGRDDTLEQNYIQMSDGAKYPLRNLGLYEAVVKKELDAPIDAKTKDGQVTPKETIDGKPATAAVQKRGDSGFSSMTQTNPDGTPYTQDQIKAVKAEHRAGNAGAQATVQPAASKEKASDVDAKIYSDAYDNAGGEGLSVVQKKTIANDAVVAARAKRNMEKGSTVAQTSTENADMAREASGRGGANNTVVSNNVSSNNTTKIVPMKASPRPEYTGSSLDRYTNRITVY